mmetsp:Transcript_51070/g.94461  ORF Transcript_51070/g.94461 Transcript_51070/m.94461 type:complete len:627 (-) Transcript_51070:37-1917(-)
MPEALPGEVVQDVSSPSMSSDAKGEAVPLAEKGDEEEEEVSLAGTLADRVGVVVRSFSFQMMTIFMIVINALWLGVDVEWNHTQLADDDDKLPLEPWSVIVGWFFCIFFSLEIGLRFLSFHRKLNCLFDGWFIFDSVLVAFMALELWVLPLIALMVGSSSGGNLSSLSSLRLIRLLRLARMGRLMQFFPELLTLVKGMVKGFNGTVFVLLFLAGITYIFAIAFTSQVAVAPHERLAEDPPREEPTEAEYMFGSIGSSMMTLFTNGMLGDNLYQTMTAIKDDSLVMYWVFIAYFCISAMTLLNMLIGILCDVINMTASQEEATIKQRQFKDHLRPIFHSFDMDGNDHVTIQEWDKVMDTAELKHRVLQDMDLEEDEDGEEYLERMRRCLFSQIEDPSLGPEMSRVHSLTQGMPFETFLDMMYSMLPDQQGTALEVEMLAHKISVLDQVTQGNLLQVEDLCKALTLRDVGDADAEASEYRNPSETGQRGREDAQTQKSGIQSAGKEAPRPSTGTSGNQVQRPSSSASSASIVGLRPEKDGTTSQRKSSHSLVPSSMVYGQVPLGLPGACAEPWSVSAAASEAVLGDDDLPPDWLSQVPLDVLLRLLKERLHSEPAEAPRENRNSWTVT